MNETSGLALMLELTDRLFRSWWTVVAGLCLGLAGSLWALNYLPKTYEATTKILVSPPTISQDFVKSTAGDDLAFRFAALKEAVLSRPYMLTLIEKTFGTKERSPAEEERLIQSIRGRVNVKVERYGSDRAGMFSLEFRDSDPKRAAQVVNDWADLYIRENSKHRSSRAEETTTTLEDLAADVRAQLTAKEQSITAFRSQHLYELPERVEANLALLASRQRDLDANQKAIQTAQDRLQSLQAQSQAVPTAQGSVATMSDPVSELNATRLAQLQRDLVFLRARYYDDHPEVKATERQINDLLAAKSRPTGHQGSAGTPALPLSPQEQAIQSQTKEVAHLQDDQQRIRRDIEVYNARIEAAPHVQLQLEERSKGYDVLQQQYRDYQSKAQSAKGAQTIEAAQKGERFEVIERAVPPTIPVAPNPQMIVMMGVCLGLFVFVGPVLLIGFVRPTVQSEERLRASVPVPVLVSIPRIDTEYTKRRVVLNRAGNIVLSALSVAILAAVCVVNFKR